MAHFPFSLQFQDFEESSKASPLPWRLWLGVLGTAAVVSAVTASGLLLHAATNSYLDFR